MGPIERLDLEKRTDEIKRSCLPIFLMVLVLFMPCVTHAVEATP